MGKTIREKSGLALSSRNKYLSKDDHEISVHLYKTLKETRLLIKNGLNLSSLLKKQKKKLLKIGFTKIDYLEVKRNDLKTSTKPHKKSRIFKPASLGVIKHTWHDLRTQLCWGLQGHVGVLREEFGVAKTPRKEKQET